MKKAQKKISNVGAVITIDGPENVGCSTLASQLIENFQRSGQPTLRTGLGCSEYIGNDLEEALKVHPLRPHTVALFRATEIADQVTKKIAPAVKAGFLVVVDRYIYSVMAQSLVRGVDEKWLKSLYSFANIPAISFVLKAHPEELVQRSFSQQGTLGFMDSGQDCVVKEGLYEGFIEYHKNQRKMFKKISTKYSLFEISAEGSIEQTATSAIKKLSHVGISV